VKDKTFEPLAFYHLGMIYLANKNAALAKQYLEEALDSEFELGPVITGRIKSALREI
jgi:hypothetical protein